MKTPRLVLAALLLAAAASGPAHAKLQVVTTLEDLSSIAAAVGGDRVETFALAKGYQDAHFVDAKPSFILKLNRADLLIVAGLELEVGYLPPMIDQSRNAKIAPGAPGYLDASAGCEILQRPTEQITRAMGDVHPYGNPHFWTDPDNGGVVARAIAARLARLDPAGAAAYQTNLAAFLARLKEKSAEWDRKMAPYRGTKVITFHNSWPNFAKRFGLVVAGNVEPKPGIPPSPTHTLEIINLIKNERIPLILVEPYFDTKTPDYIATTTGTKVLMFYPSVGGLPGIKDYFALFDYDLNAFVTAMGGRP